MAYQRSHCTQFRVAFNALSATHHSAVHVLRGHVDSLLLANLASVKVYLITTKSAWKRWHWETSPNLTPLFVADFLDRRSVRAVAEKLVLNSVVKDEAINVIVHPNGISRGLYGVQEITLAQNPYPMLPEVWQASPIVAVRCIFQRRAYQRTEQAGDVIRFYNSAYMRSLHGNLIAGETTGGKIAYQGVYRKHTDEWADPAIVPFQERKREILFVSSLTPHKRIEDLIDVLALLQEVEGGISLRVVGSTANKDYHRFLLDRASQKNILHKVAFEGFLERTNLITAYRNALIYASLSRCESFGIPAVEAQLCGTPVVVTDCCAPPEIIGQGGIAVPVGNKEAARSAFITLFEQSSWEHYSSLARRNGLRFDWDSCSDPVVRCIQHLREPSRSDNPI